MRLSERTGMSQLRFGDEAFRLNAQNDDFTVPTIEFSRGFCRHGQFTITYFAFEGHFDHDYWGIALRVTESRIFNSSTAKCFAAIQC